MIEKKAIRQTGQLQYILWRYEIKKEEKCFGPEFWSRNLLDLLISLDYANKQQVHGMTDRDGYL